MPSRLRRTYTEEKLRSEKAVAQPRFTQKGGSSPGRCSKPIQKRPYHGHWEAPIGKEPQTGGRGGRFPKAFPHFCQASLGGGEKASLFTRRAEVCKVFWGGVVVQEDRPLGGGGKSILSARNKSGDSRLKRIMK